MTPPYNESTVFSKIQFAGRGNRGLTLTPSEVFIVNEYLESAMERAHRQFVDELSRMRYYHKIKSHEDD